MSQAAASSIRYAEAKSGQLADIIAIEFTKNCNMITPAEYILKVVEQQIHISVPLKCQPTNDEKNSRTNI